MLDSAWQSLTDKTSGSLAEDGLVLLDDLKVLSFSGNDVGKFLQGYFTCDTGSISASALQPTAICNLKGRVSAFGWAVAPETNRILWIVPGCVVASVQTMLKPYLAFSKTRLEVLADDHLLLGSIAANGQGNLCASVTVELITSEAELQQRWQLLGQGRRQDVDAALIRQHVPWLTSPVTDRFLPQMLGLVELGAVSFDKGCYLGQEVVARAQHRGRVKRQPVTLEHDRPVRATPGADLLDNQGRSVGTVIQSCADATFAMSLCVLQADAQGPFQDPDTGLTMHR